MANEEESTPKTAPTPGIKRTAKEAAGLHPENVKDRLFVVTGAYSGIGVETVKALLHENGRVVIGGRNAKAQEDFVAKMKEDYPEGYVDGEKTIDLTDLASVSAFAKYVYDKYDTVDVLILNAGVMNTPAGLTKDGFEMQMGTNVIGHFLLAKILAPKTTRQVWVSSLGHTLAGGKRIDLEYLKNFDPKTSKYDGWAAYQQSKLGDILLAKEFPKRFRDMEAGSLHPGGIQTNLSRHTGLISGLKFMISIIPMMFQFSANKLRFKTPMVGASTTITVATLPSNELVIGGYYDDCELVTNMTEAALNEDDAKALFDYCDEVTSDFQ